jgi:hypothetical protein
MNRVAQFEARVERLVEGTFSRLFAGRVRPLEVAGWVARALEDHQVVSSDGIPQAPTHYWIYLQPEDYETLTSERPNLEQDLAAHVGQLAAQSGLALAATPAVFVLPRPGLAARDVLVEARCVLPLAPEIEKTREMTADELGAVSPATGPAAGRPFLILDGRRAVDLTEPLVTVGRGLDNDVILEDPRVSRRHAQMRLRYDRYVLYDLGSRGGTQVNGYSVEECVLHSGDVISFSGVQVVFGEDRSTPGHLEDHGNTPVLLTKAQPPH